MLAKGRYFFVCIEENGCDSNGYLVPSCRNGKGLPERLAVVDALNIYSFQFEQYSYLNFFTTEGFPIMPHNLYANFFSLFFENVSHPQGRVERATDVKVEDRPATGVLQSVLFIYYFSSMFYYFLNFKANAEVQLYFMRESKVTSKFAFQ